MQEIATLKPDNKALTESGALHWAINSGIRLQAGPFTLENHEYQVVPMLSLAPRKCYMKATGWGASEIEILESLHGMIYGLYKLGVLYLFPTNEDMLDFSKSRFDPLLVANPATIGQFIKAQGKHGTDKASLKKIRNAFLYLRGARLTETTDAGTGEKDASKLKGIQVDEVKFDECGLMDPSVFLKAIGRMGASKIKKEVYIFNPRDVDDEADKVFKSSDQRYFFNKCEHCGTWICAVEEFPNCVKLRSDGSGYIACKKCGKEIVRRADGKWVAKYPKNNIIMEGYQGSQLNSMFNDPGRILANFNNPPQGNLSDVYRLQLGLPHTREEDRLLLHVVLECCSNDLMPTFYKGPAIMGVDVGDTKHILIGIRTGKEQFEILRVAARQTWDEIHDLARSYNVKSAVIDLRPDADAAKDFQKKEPYKIFLCEYTETPTVGNEFSNVTGIVKSYRTGIFDTTHRLFAEKRIKLPRRCPEVEEFARQCTNAAKILETNKRTGVSIYRYREVGTGGDHYRNALNYFTLAAAESRIITKYGRANRPTMAITEYARI